MEVVVVAAAVELSRTLGNLVSGPLHGDLVVEA